MNIFVTGATGYLGRHLVKKLSDDDDNQIIHVNSKNCNLLDNQSLEKYNSYNFEYIFHLASWTQAGDFALTHQGEQWIQNQLINTNILNWWVKHQKNAKIICIGTSCSYDPSLPYIEENYLTGKPIDSLFTYAMTKRMLFTGMESFRNQFGMNYLHFIPTTLYGPNYHKGEKQMHFIFDLIKKILAGKYENKEVILWGDGNQKRELVYIQDFIDCILQLYKTHSNASYNVGPQEEFSIKEYARIISIIVDYDYNKIIYDEKKYVGAKNKSLSNSKLLKDLPEAKFIDIEKGLKLTIEWFIQTFYK